GTGESLARLSLVAAQRRAGAHVVARARTHGLAREPARAVAISHAALGARRCPASRRAARPPGGDLDPAARVSPPLVDPVARRKVGELAARAASPSRAMTSAAANASAPT